MPESIHQKTIAERIEWLDSLSRDHSDMYCSPEAYLQRSGYLAAHPTLVMAFKCMDGRIHLPYITKTPLGIIQPFRNLGGAFDMGWPYLGEIVTNSVMQAVKDARKVLVLITYHYSKGDPMRGCAGFSHDSESALASSYRFRKQIENVFGSDHQVVYPLVVGVETDEDALILHGDRGEAIDLTEFVTAASHNPDELRDALMRQVSTIFTDMPADIMRDLIPLAMGNIDHIREIRSEERALDIHHHEWVLCVGRGFDFLHVPNTAMIIGPYSPNIAGPIVTAAKIIESNMKAGRVPDDGMVLLASSPFSDIGIDYRRAVEKAKFMSGFAREYIKSEVPYIHERMVSKTCVLNWNNRKLEEIDKG